MGLCPQEQASWVCQCDESVVQRLEQDFKVTLQQQSSLDQWAAWLDNVVSQVLKPHQGSPSLPKAARQFLLKWSFYRYEESSPLAGDLLPHPNPGVRVHPNPGSGLYA